MLSTTTKIGLAKGISQAICLGRSLAGLDSQTEVVRDGLRWQLDLCEGIDLAIYLGMYETESVSVVRRLVAPGSVVLDIGANIGAHTLQMARRVGPSGKVYAYEPTLFAFRKLQRNIDLNPELKSCIVLEQIMMGEPSTSSLPNQIYSSWPLNRASHLHNKHGGRLMPTTGAGLSSVDEYVAQAGIQRIDLMKIDVDGYECSVLRGAHSTLANSRPRIVMEFAPYVMEDAGTSIDELCEMLRRHRYQLYAASTGEILPVIAKELKEFVPDGCGINVIGVPNDQSMQSEPCI